MVKGPLCRTSHNLKETYSYSIIDGLAQSSSSILGLEVLQTCPTQQKSLLSALGAINPSNSYLITFDVDNS